MKKVKKLVSIILVLILTIVPFLPVLNVEAEEELIITTYGENEEGINPNLVTNKANLIVNGVTNGDELSAYKIIDIFYDKNTNEMIYDFTNDFKTFLAQSTNDTYKNMKIEDYFNLTSDNEDGTTSESVITASTLNILVSQYTTYIRQYSIQSTHALSTTDERASAEVAAGAYLVLPRNITVIEGFVNLDKLGLIRNTYGVMIGNVLFNVSELNNKWEINDCEINAKMSSSYFQTLITGFSVKDYINFVSGNISIEDIPDPNYYYSTSSLINKKRGYYLKYTKADKPTNAINASSRIEINFPVGISYNLENLYLVNSEFPIKVDVVDNKILDSNNVEYGNMILDSKSIIVEPYIDYIELAFDVILNEQATLGDFGNKIITKLYTVDDPYVENSVATMEIENTIYTYGLELTSFNNDNTTLLKGAKYEVYSKEDLSSNSLIGEFEVGENGTGTFAGLVEGTVYLKQTKAPTGYQLIKETIPVKIAIEESVDEDNDYYYEVTTNNQAMWFLPSTGGIGTVIYTLIGLGIIGVASIFLVKYRKKTVNM